VVRPDDLIEETVSAEDAVERHLDVVHLAIVEMQIERARRRQQPVRLAQTRLEKRDVVVERIVVRPRAGDDRAVALPLEADATALVAAGRAQRRAHLALPRIERGIDVDQLKRAVRQSRQYVGIVAEQHDVGVSPIAKRRRVERLERHASSGAGASGWRGTTRTNPPRCISSRPRPPRLVSSYFAVLMFCSLPRLVSTVIRSRSPVDAMKPITRSLSFASLIRITPRPGPDRKFTSSALHSSARACRVATITVSSPVIFSTPTISWPAGALAKRRPARVLASTNGSSEKRSA